MIRTPRVCVERVVCFGQPKSSPELVHDTGFHPIADHAHYHQHHQLKSEHRVAAGSCCC